VTPGNGFEEQGSWAHGTIIRPVDGAEFDADLLVMVQPAERWTAADYVEELGKIFAGNGVYADKTLPASHGSTRPRFSPSVTSASSISLRWHRCGNGSAPRIRTLGSRVATSVRQQARIYHLQKRNRDDVYLLFGRRDGRSAQHRAPRGGSGYRGGADVALALFGTRTLSGHPMISLPIHDVSAMLQSAGSCDTVTHDAMATSQTTMSSRFIFIGRSILCTCRLALGNFRG
jgi:hypothetical protein